MSINVGTLLTNNPSSNFKGFQLKGRNLTIVDVRRNATNLLKVYTTAAKEIDQKIKRVYDTILKETDPEDYFNKMQEYKRLSSLQDEVALNIAEAQKAANILTTESSLISNSNNYYRQQYALKWVAPRAGEVLPFTILDPVATQLNVYSTKVKWDGLKNIQRKKKLSGLLPQGNRPGLNQLLRDNNKKALNKVKNTITQGFIQGKSYQQMSKDLNDTFQGVKSASMRVVRTEGNRNMNGADYLAYMDGKEDGLEGTRQVLSTFDGRTRTQSGQVDGRKDNAAGYFTYPGGVIVSYPGNSGVAGWDINDRETTIKIIDGAGPEIRRGRNPETGKNEVFSYKGFDSWAKSKGLTKNKYGQIITGPKAVETAIKEGQFAKADPFSLYNVRRGNIAQQTERVTPKPISKSEYISRGEEDILNTSKRTGYEYGTIFDNKTGQVISTDITSNSKNSINITDYKGRMKGNIFTHTHPSSNSFSRPDIKILKSTRASEFRVRGFNGKIYSAKIDHDHKFLKRIDDEQFNRMIDRKNRELKKDLKLKIAEGELTIDQANKIHYDELWKKVDRETKFFTYKEIT